MIRLAVFDLDGTLINSIEDIAAAANYALIKCGFGTYKVSEYNYFVGNGLSRLLYRIIPEKSRDEETILMIKEFFSDYYTKNSCVKTYIYNGISNLLKELSANGIKLAVASNKPDNFTKEIVKKLFGEKVFDFILGNRLGAPHKPDPRIVNDIMRILKVESHETVFIGDTNVDMMTGKNAGTKTIGCEWGFRDLKELEAAGADFIASRPEDIIDFINNL